MQPVFNIDKIMWKIRIHKYCHRNRIAVIPTMEVKVNVIFVLDIIVILDITQALKDVEEGYCQMYSYNVKDKDSGYSGKHYFTCCNNAKEKSCDGHTYQKPTNLECKWHIHFNQEAPGRKHANILKSKGLSPYIYSITHPLVP